MTTMAHAAITEPASTWQTTSIVYGSATRHVFEDRSAIIVGRDGRRDIGIHEDKLPNRRITEHFMTDIDHELTLPLTISG